jgi:hypothetical protein
VKQLKKNGLRIFIPVKKMYQFLWTKRTGKKYRATEEVLKQFLQSHSNLFRKKQMFISFGKKDKSKVNDDDELLGLGLDEREANIYHADIDEDELYEQWRDPNRGLYPFMKLLGGADDEIAFGKEDDAFTKSCETIMNLGYLMREESIILLKILKQHNVINVDSTYNDVVTNNLLMTTLQRRLNASLRTNPKQSIYGCGFVSDFDLAVNLQSKL